MSYWSGGYDGWAPRKTAAARRADAARQIKDAARRGRAMSPIAIAGRKIAHTFWGKAWCDNLERYRDFAYRLERGRSYLRSGSVIDLRIEAGKIAAMVSGSSLYDVAIDIDAVQPAAWRAIQRDCAGSIGSRIDLLGGRLSEPVMTRLCADRTGLFPAPSAIRFTCSCPDYATMCKHVAAAMYGVGARLDRAPDLLFTLRKVSADELIASAISELPAAPANGRVLADEGLAAMFGIELAEPEVRTTRKPAAPSRGKSAAAATAEPAARRRRDSVTETASATGTRGQRKPARTASEREATANAKPLRRATASSSKPPVRAAARTATIAGPSAMISHRQTPKPTRKARTPAQPARPPALQVRAPAPASKKPAPQAKAPASRAKARAARTNKRGVAGAG